MSRTVTAFAVLFLLGGWAGTAVSEVQAQQNPPDGDAWVSLFDGRSLDGWRASENAETFSV